MGVRIRVRSAWTQSQEIDLEYEFSQERVVIGRAGSADVQLPHAAVSSVHATIQTRGSGYVLVDEGSTNGTRLNDAVAPAGQVKVLRHGDVIDVGGFQLTVEVGVAVATGTSVEKTSALAQQMVRDMLAGTPQALSQPSLVILNGPAHGERYEIPPPPSVSIVGRADTCDLVVPDADASREHLELRRDLEGTTARDLGSKNGLIVNGKSCKARFLQDRDELLVGSTTIAYENPAASKLHEVEADSDLAIDQLPLLDANEPTPPPQAPPQAIDESPSPGMSPEWIIFGLAALVVIASAVAMYWLLAGGN